MWAFVLVGLLGLFIGFLAGATVVCRLMTSEELDCREHDPLLLSFEAEVQRRKKA